MKHSSSVPAVKMRRRFWRPALAEAETVNQVNQLPMRWRMQPGGTVWSTIPARLRIWRHEGRAPWGGEISAEEALKGFARSRGFIPVDDGKFDRQQ